MRRGRRRRTGRSGKRRRERETERERESVQGEEGSYVMPRIRVYTIMSGDILPAANGREEGDQKRKRERRIVPGFFRRIGYSLLGWSSRCSTPPYIRTRAGA